MRYALPAVLLTLSTSAQTFVVDASNGPGTNFTSLPTAVASVPDGATLIVRPGSYSGFLLAGKGLTVLGDGAVIQGFIRVTVTAPSQGLVLRGLSWASLPNTTAVQLQGLQGAALLENLVVPANTPCPSTCPVITGVSAVGCAQLYLRDCDVRSTISMASTTAVLESCFVQGENVNAIYPGPSLGAGNPARDALTLSNCDVQIVGDSRFEGGWGGNFGLGNIVAGANGIVSGNSALRVLDGEVYAGLQWLAVGATILQTGVGALRIAPRVVLDGAFGGPHTGPGAGSDVMPTLTGAGAPVGGSLAATVTTEDGDLVILAVGFGAPPILVPGFVDPFWLDSTAHLYAAFGVHQTATPIGAAVQVPASPTFRGLRLHWGAACFGPVTGAQATNPVVTIAH